MQYFELKTRLQSAGITMQDFCQEYGKPAGYFLKHQSADAEEKTLATIERMQEIRGL